MMSASLISIFEYYCKSRKYALEGSFQYGWHGKSVGSKASDIAGNVFWLRIYQADRSVEEDKHWLCLSGAKNLQLNKMPQVLGLEEYSYEDNFYRVSQLEYVPEKVILRTPELSENMNIPDDFWWESLKSSLYDLATYQSVQSCVRQDLINRRFTEAFGDRVDPIISD